MARCVTGPGLVQAGEVRVLASIMMVALATSGCGGGSGSSTCERPVREDLDPLAGVHPVGVADVAYQTSPPTSGPHLSILGPVGVVDEPLEPVMQVTVLARGAVLVQYGDPADAAALEPLVAVGDVVIAPASGLDDAVVATAWTVKLRCEAVDEAALEAFIAENADTSEHH